MTDSPIVAALLPVVASFEKLGVRYSVSGSVASSFYGLARATQDVDLVAEVRLPHVDALVGQLKDLFYIDADVMRDAIRRQSSFNLIHLETLIKVDVFVSIPGSLDEDTLRRGRKDVMMDDTKAPIIVSSPEDVILNKLKWYDDGGRISERQWSDILGIFRVQREALDITYMRSWASRLNLNGLLEDALRAMSGADLASDP